MSALPNVKVTVNGRITDSHVEMAVGNERYATGANAKENSYWLFVLDLTSLKPVLDMVYDGDNATVPPQLRDLPHDQRHLLILTACSLRGDRLPQGDFYEYLTKVGSGVELRRAEQVFEQMGTGYRGAVSYVLAATLDERDMPGFEEMSFFHDTYLTFELMPQEIDNEIVYLPIRLR